MTFRGEEAAVPRRSRIETVTLLAVSITALSIAARAANPQVPAEAKHASRAPSVWAVLTSLVASRTRSFSVLPSSVPVRFASPITRPSRDIRAKSISAVGLVSPDRTSSSSNSTLVVAANCRAAKTGTSPFWSRNSRTVG